MHIVLAMHPVLIYNRTGTSYTSFFTQAFLHKLLHHCVNASLLLYNRYFCGTLGTVLMQTGGWVLYYCSHAC
jgi:hypothetical protein